MPKGVVRSFEERITDLQSKKAHYQEKVRQYKKRIHALEQERSALRGRGQDA